MRKISNKTNLFEKGKPTNFGYSLNGAINYNIEEGKVGFLKLKEWDFYQITNRKFSLYAIIGHASYATSINMTLFEFDSKKSFYVGKLLPFKKVEMDNDPNGNSTVCYDDNDYHLEFKKEGMNHFISFRAKDKELGECLAAIRLEGKVKDNILVATPFNKKKEFYLNQKNCLMRASGNVVFGESKYSLNDAYGLLDWGRGRLPFKHHWVWGSGSGMVNGKLFGFNIGKFGSDEFATENIFYYDGASYKLGKVNITFSEEAYMDDWQYMSDDGNFVLTMKPIYDNHTQTKMLWVNNECHQVFGYFNGYVRINDEKIIIKDFWAFTEFAHNRW